MLYSEWSCLAAATVQPRTQTLSLNKHLVSEDTCKLYSAPAAAVCRADMRQQDMKRTKPTRVGVFGRLYGPRHEKTCESIFLRYRVHWIAITKHKYSGLSTTVQKLTIPGTVPITPGTIVQHSCTGMSIFMNAHWQCGSLPKMNGYFSVHYC